MATGEIAARFGQIVTKYVVNSGVQDDVESLDATRLAHALGLSDESVSEVRKVMNGTAGKPSTTTMAKYFKVLKVSEDDQNYVHGIGLQAIPFADLLQAIQASEDFGKPLSNDRADIRDKKIAARLAVADGDLEKADALSAQVQKYLAEVHLYAKKDLEQSAESLASTLAFRGSLALQALDFEAAFAQYSQIPHIRGLPPEMYRKFHHPIRIAYNAHMYSLNTAKDAQAVVADLLKIGIPPNVVSYNTLLTFLKSEAEARAVFAEMLKNNIKPDVFSYNTLLSLLTSEAEVVALFAEMIENDIDPDRNSVSTGIKRCVDFEHALRFAKWCKDHTYFVGRGEYEALFSFPITHLSAKQLSEAYHAQPFKFDSSLGSPLNQYREADRPEEALRLVMVAPHIGPAQKFYREAYDLCHAYFKAELAAGNDEDNLHYGFGIAACLNADWPTAKRHLTIALERCFKTAQNRRNHIASLIAEIPAPTK